jgi:hypothetical protein
MEEQSAVFCEPYRQIFKTENRLVVGWGCEQGILKLAWGLLVGNKHILKVDYGDAYISW